MLKSWRISRRGSKRQIGRRYMIRKKWQRNRKKEMSGEVDMTGKAT